MKKKILLVSHEAVTRFLMSTLIGSAHGERVEVKESLSCTDAVQKIRNEKFDLVITNNRTGSDSTTGFDVAREVHGKLEGTRVIVAAHSLSEEEQEIGKFVHPDGFLQLPFDPGVFNYIVGALVD